MDMEIQSDIDQVCENCSVFFLDLRTDCLVCKHCTQPEARHSFCCVLDFFDITDLNFNLSKLCVFLTLIFSCVKLLYSSFINITFACNQLKAFIINLGIFLLIFNLEQAVFLLFFMLHLIYLIVQDF